MTKKELKDLPQSAFEEHVGAMGCVDCDGSVGTNDKHWLPPVDLAVDDGDYFFYAICPACYAKHPAGEMWPKWAVWEAGDTTHAIICSKGPGTGNPEHIGAIGRSLSEYVGSWESALAGEHYREVVEPQARAYAKEHDIPWKWPEPEDEGDGWEYGVQDSDGEVLRWQGEGLEYQYYYPYYKNNIWGSTSGKVAEWCKAGSHNRRTCTKAEARKVCESHGGTWPEDSPPVQEEPEIVEEEPGPTPHIFVEGDGDINKCRTCGRDIHLHPPGSKPPADEPEPASEAPKPVGYVCKDCGFGWGDDRWGTGWRHYCGGSGCEVVYTETHGLPPWVQPGPPEGPWQKTHEWTGGFRKTKTGEFYLDPTHNDKVWRAEERHAPLEGVLYMVGVTRHILRPIPQKAKPGEQCKGCKHKGRFACMERKSAGAGRSFARANPTNDCEHYQPSEGETVTGVDPGSGSDYSATSTFSYKDGVMTLIECRLSEPDTPNGKDVPMNTDTPQRRSLPARLALAAGKGIGGWILKTVGTMAIGIFVYHNLGACLAFIQDPGAALSPAWDATTAFVGRYGPPAAYTTGMVLTGFGIGHYAKKTKKPSRKT